jgi:transposase-like protein
MEKKRFTDSFKRKVVQEVLSGGISKEAARRKYGLKGKSGILQWMRKFGVATEKEEKVVTNRFVIMERKQKKEEAKSKDEQIKLLEKALANAELKAEGYSRMIQIAEDQFKIKIRKKLSTKQSKK